MPASEEWRALAARMAMLDARPPVGDAELVVDHRFSFLNVERRLESVDWSTAYETPLWDYHLHYFDYALDLARAWKSTGDPRYGHRYIELWTSWLDAAADGDARLDPYPTSVRCLNGLRSLWLIEDRVPREFADRLRGGIHAQLEWLSRHLERHLGANHLLKNLTALAWGSLAFRDHRVRWRRYLSELWSEMDEQVLSDGVHYERSPMYHADVLADLLRTTALCRAADSPIPDRVPERLDRMVRALQWLSRPDGTLHLFNDAANGQGPPRQEIVWLAGKVLARDRQEPQGTFALEESGYFGSIGPDGTHRLVIDAGRPGPTYQPGHAHCDMLSFELDLDGRPFIVDSGLHGYDGDPYREYVRSTRAHNTVAIDGREQHEMWATFRVARRGEIVEARWSSADEEGFEFSAACRPYHNSSCLHKRAVVLDGRRLVVTDEVIGASQSVTSWLHFHPDVRLDRTAMGFVANVGGLRLTIVPMGEATIEPIRGDSEPKQGWYCPEFGLARPATVLELRVQGVANPVFGWDFSFG